MLRALGFVSSPNPDADGKINIKAGANVTVNFNMTTAFEIKDESQLDTAIGNASAS